MRSTVITGTHEKKLFKEVITCIQSEKEKTDRKLTNLRVTVRRYLNLLRYFGEVLLVFDSLKHDMNSSHNLLAF